MLTYWSTLVAGGTAGAAGTLLLAAGDAQPNPVITEAALLAVIAILASAVAIVAALVSRRNGRPPRVPPG